MSHLHEGVLLALRDGDATPGSAEAEAHLESCDSCRQALTGLHRTRRTVEAALSALDEPFDVDGARAAVRSRVAEAASHGADILPLRPRARRGAQALARAAGLVLVAAVGVSALPGSPVRAWVEAAFSTGGEAAVTSPASAEPTAGDMAGIRVSVDAPLRVSVLGMRAGEVVSLLWVPGQQAAVFAAAGSRFSSGEAGLEAVVSGGPVRIELPIAVRPVTLEVNGQVWLRGVDARVEFVVPPEAEDARPLRWLVPEAGTR